MVGHYAKSPTLRHLQRKEHTLFIIIGMIFLFIVEIIAWWVMCVLLFFKKNFSFEYWHHVNVVNKHYLFGYGYVAVEAHIQAFSRNVHGTLHGRLQFFWCAVQIFIGVISICVPSFPIPSDHDPCISFSRHVKFGRLHRRYNRNYVHFSGAFFLSSRVLEITSNARLHRIRRQIMLKTFSLLLEFTSFLINILSIII